MPSPRIVPVVLALALLPIPRAEAQKPVVLPPGVFAIRDARVVVEPGKILEQATVIVRDGSIEAVGPDAKVPADALVIEGKGLTVYPGFLDALSHWGIDGNLRRTEAGPPAETDPASQALAVTRPDNRKGMTPEFRVAVSLQPADEPADPWRRAGFSARLVGPEGGIVTGQGAVVSLSGARAREAVLSASAAFHLSFRAGSGNEYPRSLMGVVAHCRQLFLDAGHYRALREHHEAAMKAGKPERAGKRPPFDPALDALGAALDGKVPVVFEADSADEIHRALDFAEEFKLRPILHGGRDAWKVADRLAAAKVPVFLRINFPEPPSDEQKKKTPARARADQERRVKEEVRNAVVLHEKGLRFAFSTAGLSGDKPADKFRANLKKIIEAGLSPEATLKALTVTPAEVLGLERSMGTIARGKAAHLAVLDGDFHDPDAKVKYLFADGIRFEYEVKPRSDKKPMKPMPDMRDDKPDAAKERPKQELPTELGEDRKPKLRTGGSVLIRGATLLTVSDGVKPNTDLLVREGKIAAIGKGLKAPEGAKVVDAGGMFVMPGIVDTHCHFAISGGVNEFSLSVVPEVRVRDVINSEDVNIYRGVAGGLTTGRLLHGSANVVGGQDAVIKLKYGKSARELLVADAPRGVKFALGENVKRTDGRFPNTRLGVEAVLVRAFTEAREYQKEWERYNASLKKPGPGYVPLPPPRRDLRLEALSDVLRGDLRVHCHCYRADEILMLLRVADRFEFKVRSLQHVLEGYKIAAEIADHGASCSLFSDWWAYKIEAFDAIPFAAALLHEAGASVCLKSDSNELMRHLYQEAAKLVKYGGMKEEDALRTITLNPAKQLGLDGRIGSLEVGKDADLAIFNGHPLNGYSRVEMTLIEGEVYFQRAEKLEAFAPAAAGPAAPRAEFKPIVRQADGEYAIRNVTIHRVSDKPFVGDVLIRDGKIVDVGAKLVLNHNGKSDLEKRALDGTGLHVYPGMIDSGTVLGLTELGSATETQDYTEGGDFQPDLRASTAVNPDSELIPVTRANGVLTVVTRPTGSFVAGQSAVINLAGWVPKEMAVVDPFALHIDFPRVSDSFVTDPNGPRLGRAIARRQRDEKVRRLKELFSQALAHDAARKDSPTAPANPRLEALVPYARGQKPVVIQADREDDIREALKLAGELKVKLILSGGTDAWKLADELRERNVPVILGPVMALPREAHDPYDAPYACAAKLHEAGVRFCIRSAGSSNTRNLSYEAAMAVSYGLPPEVALNAVTLAPAEILGIDKELGSLDKGKRANLVLTNGDMLQPSTQVLALFINGKPLPPESKHTRLYQRYQERLREVRDGRAPLGTK